MTTRAIDLRCAECGRTHRIFGHTKTLILCECGHVFAVWGEAGEAVAAVDCGRWVVTPNERAMWTGFGQWRRR